MAIGRRINAGDAVFDLAFDVTQQGTRPKAEAAGVQPIPAQFFVNQQQPIEGLFGGTDAPGGLKADDMPGLLLKIANRPHHHQADGQGGVDRLFARRCFDEIGAGHHADQRGPRHIRKSPQFTGGQNSFQMRITTHSAVRTHLVVECLPVGVEHVAARDDDVDFLGTGRHRQFDFAQARLEGVKPAGKPVDTAATGMVVPVKALTAAGIISW